MEKSHLLNLFPLNEDVEAVEVILEVFLIVFCFKASVFHVFLNFQARELLSWEETEFKWALFHMVLPLDVN